jgi:hypothetical protein
MAPRPSRLTEDRLQRYLHRSDEELRWDLVAAFDQIENLREKLGSANMKVWILVGVVTAQSGIIAWLADHLISCIDQTRTIASQLVH